MQRKISFLFVLISLLLVTAGCTTPQSPVTAATPSLTPDSTPAPEVLPVPAGITGHWVLSTMGVQNGKAVIHPAYAITLTVNSDGYLTGYTGCNNYFGTLNMTGSSTPKGMGMTISGIGATKKYCAPLASLEQEYLAILEKVAAGDTTGMELILTAASGDTLVYQRAAITPAPQ
ncbi:MAG: META domain-containing protein [Methanomicrobiales archaeon]|nr:META domain-containing protein [Methanomicrobiales archaeon]